jgi:hypothetical protein
MNHKRSNEKLTKHKQKESIHIDVDIRTECQIGNFDRSKS